MEGWIKLYRQFLEWEWFTRAEMVQLFLYFLIKANHEPARWRGIDIKQGQFITSLDRISRETGLSVQTIRTSINRLKSTNEITVESTNRNTMITICNYSIYQEQKAEDNKQNNIPSNIPSNNQTTNEQQTDNKQLTTNKNEKNNKNDKEDLQSNDCPNSDDEVLKEKPKRKRTTKPKKSEEEIDKDADLNKKSREAFEARYFRLFKEKYYWQAKDAGNMTRLLNALKHQREQKGLSNENNVEVVAALTSFLNEAVKDEWIVKNFSISVLFSKFNEIVSSAKTREHERKKSESNYGTK